MDKKIIYVYSTKGGVGKSTISLNLAFYLKKLKHKVTLIDLDFSGPSIHRLIEKNYKNKLRMVDFYIMPLKISGINISSIGFIKSPTEISFLNGKYAEGAIDQFLHKKILETSDIIIIDMPPGFGEFHRYILTKQPGNVLIVTTPHFLSQENIKRGIRLLEHLKIPIFCILENMAYFICPKCKEKHKIYGESIKQEEFANRRIISIPFSNNLNRSLKDRKQINLDKNIDSILKKLALDLIKGYVKCQ